MCDTKNRLCLKPVLDKPQAAVPMRLQRNFIVLLIYATAGALAGTRRRRARRPPKRTACRQTSRRRAPRRCRRSCARSRPRATRRRRRARSRSARSCKLRWTSLWRRREGSSLTSTSSRRSCGGHWAMSTTSRRRCEVQQAWAWACLRSGTPCGGRSVTSPSCVLRTTRCSKATWHKPHFACAFFLLRLISPEVQHVLAGCSS